MRPRWLVDVKYTELERPRLGPQSADNAQQACAGSITFGRVPLPFLLTQEHPVEVLSAHKKTTKPAGEQRVARYWKEMWDGRRRFLSAKTTPALAA